MVRPAMFSCTTPHAHHRPHFTPGAGDSGERSDAVAVGTWAMDAHIYALPSLKPLFKEALPTDVIPRRCAMLAPTVAAPLWGTVACTGLICAALRCIVRLTSL